MTRSDFVRVYARRSELSDKFAVLGLIDVGGVPLIALPCGCGADDCEGWAMVSGGSVLDHLFLNAPDLLKDAYRHAVDNSGGEGS